MMKPDLKVTIAWGTESQYDLARALKIKLDTLRKTGYPVDAQMIFSNGNGIPIVQRATEIFSNFDYAIFLFGIKSIDVMPLNGKTISLENTTIIKDMLNNLLDEGGVVSPRLSQNIIYELGIANATHNDPSSIMWFFSGGNVKPSYFPSDVNLPAIYSFGSCTNLDEQVNHILKELHFKVKAQFNYLGSNYEDPVTSILFQTNYRPNLMNIISRKNFMGIDFLGSYNSPLDAYFEQEYSLFNEENIEYNLDCRIQYFIDRAVLFVYLRNNQLWVRAVSQLSDAVESMPNRECSDYFVSKLAIDILSNVMIYHKMMTQQDASPKLLFDRFEQSSNDRMLKNSMLRCLCFDYKGLCAHKVALEHLAVSIGKKSFWATSKENIEALIDSKKNAEKDSAKEYLRIAIRSFDEVLRLSSENSMGVGYLWEGFALYNKARCEYLLNILVPNSFNWDLDMIEAIRVRGEYAGKYESITSFPVVISHNLKAEYYLAKLEQYFYIINENPTSLNISEFNMLKEEVYNWGRISSFYTDVLSVTNKLNVLEKIILEY